MAKLLPLRKHHNTYDTIKSRTEAYGSAEKLRRKLKWEKSKQGDNILVRNTRR